MDEETPKKRTCNPTCVKWAKKASKVVGIVSVLTSVGFAIHNSVSSNDRRFDYDMPYNINAENDKKPKCFLHGHCKLECQNTDENKEGENIATHVNSVSVNKNCSNTSLTITDAIFKHSKLSNGWLANITMTLKELIIKEGVLSVITKKAFAGHPFSGTFGHLKIISGALRIARMHLNLDAESLFNGSCCKPLTIEKGALNGIDRNVERLNLHGYKLTPEDIINLSGSRGAYLHKLQILDLSNNYIPELGKRPFISVPNVRSLYLQNIGLQRVHPQTFRGANSIKRLNLTSNDLRTLPNEVFANLTNLNRGGIELWKNNWNCNCSLRWLENFYLKSNYINKQNPPLCDGEKKFEEVEFCPI